MSSNKLSPTFVALALGLVGLVGGLAFILPGSAGGAVESEARTSRWLSEVEKSAAEEACPSLDLRGAGLVIEQTLAHLPIWAERERVDAAQVLRSWQAVEVALKCFPLAGRQEAKTSLEAERNRLRVVFSDNLRAWHTSYVRASENHRSVEAARALRGLLFLLSAHSGGLRSDLERALRHLEKKQVE